MNYICTKGEGGKWEQTNALEMFDESTCRWDDCGFITSWDEAHHFVRYQLGFKPTKMEEGLMSGV